jgi:hypothetical protein
MAYRRRGDDAGRGFTPSGGGFSPGPSAFALDGGGFGPSDGGGGGVSPPAYDLAGLLAYAQIAGYGTPSGGWMPHTTQPDKAEILARISGRL